MIFHIADFLMMLRGLSSLISGTTYGKASKASPKLEAIELRSSGKK
jgi:hypothetical protein